MKVKTTTVALVALTVIGVQYSGLRAQSPRSVWDGVYADAQAKQGQALYNDKCSSCHGDTLMGGESAPALAGGEFLSNWNGLTLGDLFERIRTTMPQNKAGSLSLSVNQFPTGKTELPQQTEVLKEIKIDAQKPSSK
jgi:mono/diheme cytochrome c family protein